MSGLQHVITLQPPFDGTAIYLCCSCSDEPLARIGFPAAAASLVEVNEIAHQHITAAEGPEPAFSPQEARRRAAETLRPFFTGGGHIVSASELDEGSGAIGMG